MNTPLNFIFRKRSKKEGNLKTILEFDAEILLRVKTENVLIIQIILTKNSSEKFQKNFLLNNDFSTT